MTDAPGRSGGTDQLDERLRGLHVDTDSVILPESSVVRRHGDRRRRLTQAGTVLGLAVLTVGIVGITSTLTHRQTATPPATPTSSESAPPLSLADSPFLQSENIPPVWDYSGFTESAESIGTSTGSGCFTNPGRWGATTWRSRSFISDLDATIVETVLAFPDAATAHVAARRPAYDYLNEARIGLCAVPAPGTYSDRSPEDLPAGDQAYRLARLLPPTTDGGLEYHEVAVGRIGQIVVVLEWASLGRPAGGDGWALTDPLVATALERAIAP